MAEIFEKYTCTYCQEGISGLRVKCAECKDFELCLECFSSGAEIGPHKNDHSYQLMDCGTASVYLGNGGWTARELLKLLDAVEVFGLRNWDDISKHIETRTPEEAKEEYTARFLEGSIGRLTWPAAATARPRLADVTEPDSGPLSPSHTGRLPPLDVTQEEATQLGYMPQRDDFDREFDNDAESLVSTLFINTVEDDDLDVALKLAHVDMYTRRLRERARRKRLARDYQLVAQFFAPMRKDKPNAPKKKLSKEDRELQEQFRPFSQLLTAQEQEQILTSVRRERELRAKLVELAKLRSRYNVQEDASKIERAKLIREWREKRLAGSSGPIPSAQSMEITKEGNTEEGDLSSVEEKYTQPPSISCSPPLQLDSIGDAAAEGSEAAEVPLSPKSPLLPGLSDPLYNLSAGEKQLCSSLKINPSQYISLKTILLTEYLKRTEEDGEKSADMLLPQLSSSPSPGKTVEKYVLNYLVNSGWITAS
ncbi:transcriptional adapter 2-beta isoform X2 [Ischnura elegans]|uniref:transcriptional adapter 2-beta isoform X2 n=1 Tax=Ischnura elegans TaxID=197161 RepID=UPI001ED879ED|nr:transcriptional adapter 2-beta isoform X2 [Ischnura elegans]XP_046402844.1 transcriptional adapter 2-beta isoform X2 [Ischnura elegans]XP_046402845.1 transcriptional adapter 2-beta isoform X2 [Ischnura elegans]